MQFEGCLAEPLQTITAILLGSKWSCLLLRIVLQDALSEVTKIYPLRKLRVFVDDITALFMGKNKKVAEMAKKMMRKLKEEVGEKDLILSSTEKGKEGGKCKMIASCGFLEERLRECSKEEGGDDGRQCGHAWSGHENQSQEDGSERKSKNNEVQGYVLAHEEEEKGKRAT